jgi:hypothetical protein
MTDGPDCDPGLPAIEPSAGFAGVVMDRIAELEGLRAQATAQSRALATLWALAGLGGALGALAISSVVTGPLPDIPGLAEVARTVVAVSDAAGWLPAALVAAALGLAGAAIGQVLSRRPIPAEGRP